MKNVFGIKELRTISDCKDFYKEIIDNENLSRKVRFGVAVLANYLIETNVQDAEELKRLIALAQIFAEKVPDIDDIYCLDKYCSLLFDHVTSLEKWYKERDNTISRLLARIQDIVKKAMDEKSIHVMDVTADKLFLKKLYDSAFDEQGKPTSDQIIMEKENVPSNFMRVPLEFETEPRFHDQKLKHALKGGKSYALSELPMDELFPKCSIDDNLKQELIKMNQETLMDNYDRLLIDGGSIQRLPISFVMIRGKFAVIYYANKDYVIDNKEILSVLEELFWHLWPVRVPYPRGKTSSQERTSTVTVPTAKKTTQPITATIEVNSSYSHLMTDLMKNLHTWKQIEEDHFQKENQAVEYLESANREILAVTDRVWPKADETVLNKLKLNRELIILTISRERAKYMQEITDMGGKIIIDDEPKFIPLGVLVVDKRYTGVVLASDPNTLDWSTVYYTEDPSEAEKARRIFEYIWDNHPLRNKHPYNYPEFKKLVRN